MNNNNKKTVQIILQGSRVGRCALEHNWNVKLILSARGKEKSYFLFEIIVDILYSYMFHLNSVVLGLKHFRIVWHSWQQIVSVFMG